jgi:hypothetical protein
VTPGFLENLWTLPQVLYLGTTCVYLLVTGSDVFLIPNTVKILETESQNPIQIRTIVDKLLDDKEQKET